MSPPGGLRGRRGSILGTAVQLYSSEGGLSFFGGHQVTFRRVGRSDPARLLGRNAPEGAVGKVLCEAPKSNLMPPKKGHSKSLYSSRPTVYPVLKRLAR